MTTHELSQMYWLRREIAQLEENISRLTAEAEHEPDAELAAERAKILSMMKSKQFRCIREHKRIEEYIDSISDSYLRQIVRYRFADGLSWQQIANRFGNGVTASSLKKIYYRFAAKK